jgi:Trk K+ transport system NAD-binding subunit
MGKFNGKINGSLIRSLLKSPYVIYPIAVILIVLVYTELFLLLHENFNAGDPDFFTAFYWVVVTMTTTGYGDIYPITLIGKLFSILVICTGLFIFFAVFLPLLVTPSIDKWIKSPRKRIPESMKSHTIICGYNALVDTLIKELAMTNKQFVVVDPSEANILRLQARGYYAIQGDPGDEEVLKLAHIEKASMIITNAGDAKNAAVVLTASQVSDCFIIAVMETLDMADYMKYAGADVVVSPKQMLGMNMGITAISSLSFEITGIVDIGQDLKVCKLPVYPDNRMIGKSFEELKIRENTGATIVAVFKNGEFIVNPPASTVLKESMVLVLVGTSDQLINVSDMIKIRHTTRVGPCIIAGFGDVGKEVAKKFDEKNIDYTIVDLKEYPGKKQVRGDSTHMEVLIDAGIGSASTLLVTLNDDDKNMLTTLLGRNLNPYINIIARANLDRSVSKIYRAGADYVTSLSTIGGQMLARIVEKGAFEDVIPLEENLLLSKFDVTGSGLEGMSIKGSEMRTRTGCTIIGIMQDGNFYPNPDPSKVLSKGMIIITVGTLEQLERCSSSMGLKKVL